MVVNAFPAAGRVSGGSGIHHQSRRKKTLNKVKATLKARQGPVEKDQSRSPFADAIARFWEEDILSFAIPAHSGGRGRRPSSRSGRG
jgi:hypothetical protein